MSNPQFIDTPLDGLLARTAEFKAKGWRFVQCCATRIGEGLFELLYTFCDDLFGIDVVGVTLDYDGNFYHLHIPTPMAHASERAKKAAAKAAE